MSKKHKNFKLYMIDDEGNAIVNYHDIILLFTAEYISDAQTDEKINKKFVCQRYLNSSKFWNEYTRRLHGRRYNLRNESNKPW